jgi:hypothetical protein
VKLIPVVALVDEDTHAKLAPLIADIAERFAAAPKNRTWETTMLLNGWTHDAIAWGLVLAAAGREDLELVDKQATGGTTEG